MAFESENTAKCKLCQKTFKIDNTELLKAVSHGQEKIQKSRINTASSYSTLSCKSKIAASNSGKSTSVNVNFKKPLESSHDEILWAI